MNETLKNAPYTGTWKVKKALRQLGIRATVLALATRHRPLVVRHRRRRSRHVAVERLGERRVVAAQTPMPIGRRRSSRGAALLILLRSIDGARTHGTRWRRNGARRSGNAANRSVGERSMFEAACVRRVAAVAFVVAIANVTGGGVKIRVLVLVGIR